MSKEQYLASTSAMITFPLHQVMTTGFEQPITLQEVAKEAKEYVDKVVEEFYFHRCLCSYCNGIYEANLQIGYECPGCGAREYKIVEEVKREVAVDREEFERRGSFNPPSERARSKAHLLGG